MRETMRAHFLQHVPFEGLGSIAAWLDVHDVALTSTRFFEDSTLPSIDQVDVLIVMGGPMSVDDESRYPWPVKEKLFISEMLSQEKAVLGICLGAQLIASALGARVYPKRQREIG
jgi:GMP synthase-like glutamine amidotransferase